MAAVVPFVTHVSPTLVEVGGNPGGGGGDGGRHRPTTLKPLSSSSSRRRTLKDLEQKFNQRRSKDILHLLKEALCLLDRRSFDTDPHSYAVLLKSCADANSLLSGQFIHQHISANGYEHLTFLCNFLVDMYAKCGALDEARFLFDGMDEPNVFSWTIMIAAYAHHGCFEEAYKLFLQMRRTDVQPNEYTFSTVLGTCLNHRGLAQGRYIHACAIDDGLDSDAVVGTALVDMYGKCGCVKDARLVFHKIRQHDVVALNAMIATLVEHGEGNSALVLFHQMVQDGIEPDKVTFATILGACVHHNHLEQGEMIHTSVVSLGYISNLVVMNALIDMYGKCGSSCSASVVFNQLQHRDVVSWTAIIVAHMQHPREAIQLFKGMLQAGLAPNEFTYASVLTACTSLQSLKKGQVAHHCIVEAGLETNVFVATALLSMYGKCLTLRDALWVFDQVHERDLVLWNAIIAIYAQHGLGKEALDSLQQMQQDGHMPDAITFNSMLSACSHAGLVDECCAIYATMSSRYNVMPSVEHCGCMVDLFGRASLLREAEDFIESMHLKPNLVVWEIFLNSCTLLADKGGIEYAKSIRMELVSKSSLESSAVRKNASPL